MWRRRSRLRAGFVIWVGITSSAVVQGCRDPEALELWCGQISRMGRYCREIGVRFCLHNHGAELAHGAAELQAVMERTDAREVSLLLDLSYFPDAGLQAGEWITRYASRLAGLHLREHVGGKEAMLGEGSLDAAAVAAALRKASWSGWVILEVNKRADMPSRELVAHGRRYMRERMKI
jgi:inosose dehydratase